MPGAEDKAPKRTPTLLHQSTVPMTVFAQDPSVTARPGPAPLLTPDHPGVPILTRIPVPAQRLQGGPRGHRFHVVDIAVNTAEATTPTILHDRGHPWSFVDRWGEIDAEILAGEAGALASDPEFLAQNVFAVASSTLALFERHLGRPIPWRSGEPQLFLVPRARLEVNAGYWPHYNAVFFGWSSSPGQPPLYTAACYDVIAHEVTHAILDGLRPRYYSAPALPDQLAFHEALADLVAVLSVFTLPAVAETLLRTDHFLARPAGAGNARIHFPGDEGVPVDSAMNEADRAALLAAARAEDLKRSPLLRFAEQVGERKRRRGNSPDPGDPPSALRASVTMKPGQEWQSDPEFEKPHRRAEVLVAAFLQTLVKMWAGRLTDFDAQRGMDPARVAEEGTKAAEHLLGMLLRALDYLPPVELEFADVIDAVLTADRSLVPDDSLRYREALSSSFAAFGIEPPEQRISDEEALDDEEAESTRAAESPAFPPDPDAIESRRLRYEHLNVAALRASPEEVYEFIWNNSARLGIDVRFDTRVERVIASTRVGPDGLVITEVMADYIQSLRGPVEDLPDGLPRPRGLAPQDVVGLWGGGVLIFDQFGRFRQHQRKPLTDLARQGRRLAHLVGNNVRGPEGVGVTDGRTDLERFALLHPTED